MGKNKIQDKSHHSQSKLRKKTKTKVFPRYSGRMAVLGFLPDNLLRFVIYQNRDVYLVIYLYRYLCGKNVKNYAK